MDCIGLTSESPYVLMLKVAFLIPISHYLFGFLFLLLVFLYNFVEMYFIKELFTGFKGQPVSLTFNSCCDLYQEVVSKCKTLHGRFSSTPWLCSPHLQTIFLQLFERVPACNYQREMLKTSDGGTIALDWLRNVYDKNSFVEGFNGVQSDDRTPIVVVIPGLTSDSNSAYVKHLAFKMVKSGWNVVVSNHRGLGGVSVTSDRLYNAGCTEDIRKVIDHLHTQYPQAPLFAVGTSIGSNVMVKYLGEEGANTVLVGAAAICSPWDLLIGDRFIKRRLLQRSYDRVLGIGLKDYVELITAMEEQLPIAAITPTTSDWTCKVRLVDIGKPGEGKARGIKYLNMIFQDAQKTEVKAILYGDDIPLYRARFTLFDAYLITSARVQEPTLRYEKPLHTYEWIIDKKTIVDSINEDRSAEAISSTAGPGKVQLPALSPPTITSMASFQEICDEASRSSRDQLRSAEFNVLAVVVNCYPPRYVASMQKHLQELIIIDTSKHALTFTLWEEAIIQDEGTRLLAEFAQHPIIFARRVGVSKYNGTSLTTKFNTTIQIAPPYTECIALQSWVSANTAMLKSFALRSTSPSGCLISAPVEEQIIPIASIYAQQDGQTFTIEARVIPPSTFSCCYILACPTCRQEVRNLRKRMFHCPHCKKENMLISRCRFEATLTDASGSTKGTFLDEQAAALLSLTPEQIYNKAQSPGEEHEQPMIPATPFRLQVKKAFTRATKAVSPRVFIMAINQTGNIIPPLSSSTPADMEDKNKRAKQDISPPKEDTGKANKTTSHLKMKEKLEPPTPRKHQ